MSVTAGEVLGVKAPGTGLTVRLPVMLLDTAGAVVTGVAFDAAGMAVEYSKEGDSSYTTFPTFDTNNWDEIGYGLYVVIIRQSDATELALLDTEGHFYLYVVCTATRGDVFMFKVNPADVARDDQWTDAKAAYVDVAVSSRSTYAGGAVASVTGAVGSVASYGTLVADIVTAVWAAGARTLTSFGTLVADIAAAAATAVWVAGDRTLTSFGALVTDVVAGVWAYASRTLTAWLGGGKSVTFQVRNGDGAAIGGCPVKVENAGGQILAQQNTNAGTGDLTLQLDEADDYVAYLGPLYGYAFDDSYPFDVGAAASQDVALVGTKLTAPPAPANPEMCVVYAYVYEVETGDPVGAGDGTLKVVHVVSKPASAASVYGATGAAASTDANGLVQLELVRGCVVLLEADWPGVTDLRAQVTVPDEAIYDIGDILQPPPAA